MAEATGRVWFTRSVAGGDDYLVRSNTGGTIQYVGRVWPEPDWSAAAKRSKRARKVWFARMIPTETNVTMGPFPTRDAAARALV